VTDHSSLDVFQPLVFGSFQCLQRLLEQDGPLSLNRFTGMLCFFKFKNLPNSQLKMRDFVFFYKMHSCPECVVIFEKEPISRQ